MQTERIRIGREESNDIWVDHPSVRAHTLLIYLKEEHYCIKVYDGAKVLLNGVPVTGMHRLYSGDRLGIADREFLYARDDTPAECALGLTVLVDGVVAHAETFRRTRTRIGRRDTDLCINDPAVGDKHLMLECYSPDGIYVQDLGVATGTLLGGKKIIDRVQLRDGATLQIGRIGLRIHVLPTDAHGLLLAEALSDQPKVPLAAPSPMDRSPGKRLDPSAQGPRRRQADARPVQGGFIRPLHQQNAEIAAVVSEPEHDAQQVPPTEIGSLQQIMRQAQLQQHARLIAERPPLSDPELSSRPPPSMREIGPSATRSSSPGITVRTADQPPPVPTRPQRPDLPRETLAPRPRQPLSDEPLVLVSGPAKRSGFYDARTDVLDTEAVRSRRDDPAQWLQEAEQHFGARSQGAPLTMALDVVSGRELNGEAALRSSPEPVRRSKSPEPATLRPSADPSRLARPLGEAELRANPGILRDRPELQDRDLSGPLAERQSDGSRRPVQARVIDRSRRLDENDTK